MSKINARFEFLEHIQNRQSAVKCAQIAMYDDGPRFFLKVGYSPEQFSHFVQTLDFTYYNGYGGQELFGTIWYSDGTWSEREEYDGSEWWEYRSCPEVPEEPK